MKDIVIVIQSEFTVGNGFDPSDFSMIDEFTTSFIIINILHIDGTYCGWQSIDVFVILKTWLYYESDEYYIAELWFANIRLQIACRNL